MIAHVGGVPLETDFDPRLQQRRRLGRNLDPIPGL
jgi:hypothetical protein